MNSSLMLPIKVAFKTDIRRFSVTPQTPFELIPNSIARFYNLNVGQFKIWTENNEEFAEEHLATLFRQQPTQSKEFFVLRLRVEQVELPEVEEPKKEELQKDLVEAEVVEEKIVPEVSQEEIPEVKENVKEETAIDLPALFEEPYFRTQLAQYLRKALASKPLLELVQNDFSHNLVSLMSEIAMEEKKKEEEKKEAERLEQERKSIVEKAPEDFVIIPNVEISSPLPVPSVEEIKEPEEVIKVEEKKPKEEDPILTPLIENLSPIRSFISSLFVKKRENTEENQVEELLAQLEAMGFTDREANMKSIKFHNQFQEGLNDIVEDLLIQSSSGEKGSK